MAINAINGITVSTATVINGISGLGEVNGQTLSGGGGGGDYSSTVLALSPILYWRLGEASGTVAEDTSPNNRDGTYDGATLGVTGLLVGDANTAVSLDGVDDRVYIASEAALEITGDITFSALAKPSSLGQSFKTVCAKALSSGATERQYEIGTDNADHWRLVLTVSGSFVVLNGTTVMSTSRADHLVATVNGTSAKFYVNGVEEASDTITAGSLDTTGGDFAVGQLGSLAAQQFAGVVDEVFIVGAGISGAEATALFSATGL